MRASGRNRVSALADPVHHPGRVVTRGVASRLAQLQPRGVRTRAGRPQVGGARGNDPTVDGHLQLFARRVEARDEEGNVEFEALAQPPAGLAGLAVGVDDEPRQDRGQEHEVIEAGGRSCGNGFSRRRERRSSIALTAGAVGRAPGQRVPVALEEVPQVVGGALPVLHRHHDGGTSEGAVADREYHWIRGTHRIPLGAYPVRRHHVRPVELLADAALPDRGDHRAAKDLVLAPVDRHRAAAPVVVGLAERCLHALERELVAARDHCNPSLTRPAPSLTPTGRRYPVASRICSTLMGRSSPPRMSG